MRLKHPETSMTDNVADEVEQVEHATNRPTQPGVVTTDPLTWSKWMKIGITLNICANAFLNNVCAAGLVPILGPVSAEFGIPITIASYVMSYNVLAQGLSNLIWVPTMLCFGKRWVILASMTLLLPCIAWAAVSTSYESLLGARVLGGFASGASETFAPVIIGDIWYEHDLATALGFFALCTLAGACLGQAALGYVTEDVGWRWAFWVTFIACGLNLFTMFLWLPETTFQRGLSVGDTAGDLERSEKQRKEPISANLGAPDSGMHVQGSSSEPLTSMRPNLWFIRHPQVDYSANWFIYAVRPFSFVLAPTVLWASVAYGVAAGGFTSIGVCIPQLLGAPPYNYNSATQGLFSLCSFVGVILGGTVGSRLVDIVNARIEKRRSEHGQSHKPEERLIMIVVPFFTVTTGLVLYGVAVDHQLSWIGPAFGYGIHSFGFAVLAGITFSYAVDSYLVRSGEVMVFNNTIRALLSFGFAHFTPNFLNQVGAGVAYSVLAAVIWGLLLFAIPVFFFGPKLRDLTNRYV
ncbi:major facilitator superfamily transporter [Fusarium tjaetaba]|uniref:Major facilitator superfamily transporter n=1 Tax=Fusarium tjaetaba TaxID=1567544 RepID=A0A8H5VUM2_9HYPO|nr:major facilitator superfamily transporter [Fusarium tjaetaba]KAF5635013.1 major facilitator superfamily transporter [Fusarium tjaetaba]